MRALAVMLALLLAGAAAAEEAAPEEWVPRRVAALQTLDKVTARVSVIQAEVGRPASFGTLSILVRRCDARPPDEVPDAAVFLEISDSRQPAGAPPVFRGWMFANAPGVSMLEHPVYDVRVLDCH